MWREFPKVLHEHINTAFPANVTLVGTVLPNGFAQISPRGTTMVYDDEHLALWERGIGSTNENLHDGTKVTVFLRKTQLRELGLLPSGGIARFYGTANDPQVRRRSTTRSGRRLIEPEKDRDPDKKGYGVLIKVERAEDLSGKPLTLEYVQDPAMAAGDPCSHRRRRSGRPGARARSRLARRAVPAGRAGRRRIVDAKMFATGIRTVEFCRRWGIADQVKDWGFPRDFPFDNVFVTSLTGHEIGRIPMPSIARDQAVRRRARSSSRTARNSSSIRSSRARRDPVHR